MKLRTLVVLLFLVGATAAHAATFTVNTTDGAGPDSAPGDGVCLNAVGACSLLAAVMEAEAVAGTDRIEFAIPVGGVATIALTTPLPEIFDPIEIDGFTQGCPGPGPCVELVGAFVPGADGISIAGGDSTVRGLAIGLFVSGIRLSGGRDTVIESNYLGTDASGTVPRGNQNGILVLSPDNLIGGLTPDKGNLVSANTDDGIDLRSPGNRVLSNIVGGDDFIPEALGNEVGIRVTVRGEQIIGAPGAGNVVSGNRFGIWLAGANVSDVVVQANCIGPVLGCTLPLGNDEWGISMFSSQGNLIGGTGPGEGNVIGGNRGSGISISSGLGDDNVVVGNFIGTDAGGTAALGNVDHGILIFNGADGNRIGGPEPGAGNLITRNFRSGILIFDADANLVRGNTIVGNREHGVEVGGDGTGNEFRGNSISVNLDLGIDLGGDGVTPNDPGDVDTGPNDLQNYPQLTAASTDGVQTVVAGVLESRPNGAFRIELFATTTCDGTHGQGAVPLGELEVTTDGAGTASFDTSLDVALEGQVITATATDEEGNTSEFSECRLVTESVLGACCLASGGCALTSAQDCDGTYQGDGTVCEPDLCPDAVPATSTSGLILLALVLLGLGAVFRLARSRPPA